MGLYPIEFIDKNNNIRTGLTNNESFGHKGAWIWNSGKREFIKMHQIVQSTKVLNVIHRRKDKEPEGEEKD
ncbi:hypothetical protein JW824_07525 [bacterium]|nr:hypothetical protein [bacterium]RQV95074.1 MAG: hypothetical protein EH221_06915 [bacterium]